MKFRSSIFTSSIYTKGLLLLLCPLLLGFTVCLAMFFFLAASETEIKVEGRLIALLNSLSELAEITANAAINADHISQATRNSLPVSAELRQTLMESLNNHEMLANKIHTLCEGSKTEIEAERELFELCQEGQRILALPTPPGPEGIRILKERELIAERMAKAVNSLTQVVEDKAAAIRAKRAMQSKLTMALLSLSLVLVIGLTAFALFVLGRSILNRAQRLNENISRFSKELDLLPQISASDEIADLEKAFRQTSARLSQARDEEREYFELVSAGIRRPLQDLEVEFNKFASALANEDTVIMGKKIETMRSSIRQLTELQTYLEDSKALQSEELVLQLESISLSDLAGEVTSVMQPFASKYSVKLRLEQAPEDRVIQIDRLKFVRVLVNLISNAIKFSPAGSEVVLKILNTQEGVVFEVVDSGQGIPKENLESIFGAFKQVSNDDSVNNKGFGLGLAICKRIVDAHKGEIEVISEMGKGSLFRIILKVAQV